MPRGDARASSGVPFETEVVSAHRTPDKLFAYAEAAESRGLQVIIAGAGGAAHLPGMASSKTLLPVLGVPGRVEDAAGARLAALDRADARGRARRDTRDRAGRRRERGAPRGSDRGSLGRRRSGTTRCVSREPDRVRARSARSVHVTHLVGCIGGGQLGRMLALAGARLGVRFRFLDPAPDACAGQVGELSSGRTTIPSSSTASPDGTDAVTYEFENVPVEAARRVGAVPDARALELGQDRLVEKELLPAARDRGRRASARSTRPACPRS